VTYVVALARRATAAGLQVWIDFHLSDWWADPGHQLKPDAWAALGATDLEAAVRAHVGAVLGAVSAVADVALVQVGNEISPGALWPEAGQACADSGSVMGACKENWAEFARLIAAGIGAARAAVPAALIAIHTDLGNRGKDAAADAIWWHSAFDAALPPGVDYDVIALSYYMEWNALGPAGEASIAAALSARFPARRVLMAETRASWTGSPTGPYAATPAGQLAFWRDTIGNASGWLGVAWWGGEYVGNPKLAQFALFDSNYTALPALTDGWAAR
jgi:arabinogalactan endo-1,4-beta-galactosidase